MPFRLLMPAYELWPEKNVSEPVLVQGTADLVFLDADGAVVVDYKTDMRADGDYLAEKYRRQVHIYKKAVERLFGVTVQKTVLFALSAGTTIEV